jgi:hypothetical protein
MLAEGEITPGSRGDGVRDIDVTTETAQEVADKIQELT